MSLRTPMIVAALAAALVAAPALAQDRLQRTGGLSAPEWDENRDSRLDRGEFDRIWDETGRFEALDLNDDGAVQESELQGELYTAFDGDDDDLYDSTALREGLITNLDGNDDGRYGDGELSDGLYTSFDFDGDGYLDPDEIGALEDRTELF